MQVYRNEEGWAYGSLLHTNPQLVALGTDESIIFWAEGPYVALSVNRVPQDPWLIISCLPYPIDML